MPKKITSKPSEEELLAKQVAARNEQVERYVKFAIDLLDKQGKVVSSRVEQCHTRVIQWLTGFAHFSFHCESGMTSMGGNAVKIYYHPKAKEIPIDSAMPVLKVYWQPFGFNVSICDVNVFDEAVPWQTALNRAITDRKNILTAMKGAQQAEKRKAARADKTAIQGAELKKQAVRLGLLPRPPTF